MRTYDTATGVYLGAREGIISRTLVWITAKNRSTGDPETMGLWNGEQDREFSIGGEDRTYVGAGPLLELEPMTFEIGLNVRMHSISLSPIDESVAQAIRVYDPRLAPIEMHRVLFDTETRDVVGSPHRVFKGWIDEIDIETGDSSRVTVAMASNALTLTRTLAIKKSDASQQRRSGSDRFRRYNDVSAVVPEVWWGEIKGRPETDRGRPQGRRR